MKNYRQFFSLLLSVLLILNLSVSADAIIPGANTMGYYEIIDSETHIDDEKIVESVALVFNGELINIQRTTYADNTVIISYIEDGVSKRTVAKGNYSLLRNTVEIPDSLPLENITMGRVEGYTYTMLTIQTETYSFTPKAATYQAIFDELMNFFSSMGSVRLTVISGLAAIVCAASYKPTYTKVILTKYWYEAKTDSGSFVSYYCEYVASAYERDDEENMVYIGSQTGDYHSLSM